MDETMDNYAERFDQYEYETDEEWMDAAIDYGILEREKRDDILKYIHRVNKRGEYYKPTDIRITDTSIYVPRTMQSLHGYIRQWNYEEKLAKANQEKITKRNFTMDEIPDQIKGDPKNKREHQPKEPPPSLKFNITEERLNKLIEDMDKQSVINKKSINIDSMRYAITGIMSNTSFEPITILRGTKGSLYANLLELQQEENRDSKVLTAKRKRNAGNLFKYDNGELIGELSNPKR